MTIIMTIAAAIRRLWIKEDPLAPRVSYEPNPYDIFISCPKIYPRKTYFQINIDGKDHLIKLTSEMSRQVAYLLNQSAYIIEKDLDTPKTAFIVNPTQRLKPVSGS